MPTLWLRIFSDFFYFVDCRRELAEGIKIFDENENEVGKSKKAAISATTQVLFSRIIMASPSMCKFSFIFCGSITCYKNTFCGKLFLFIEIFRIY